MLLAFDIGNTETTVGVFARDRLRAHFRLTTDAPRTADEFAVLLRSLLEAATIPLRQIDGAAFCSVVPPATPILIEACRRATGVDPLSIDAAAAIEGRLPVTLPVDEPLTVGADRVANALAAAAIVKRDCIIVDIGTATTYDCITAEGSFFGGVIQPGVRTSAATLFHKTAQLPPIAIADPGPAIATNTEACIQAGVVYGAADAIDGIVRRIKQEWPRKEEPMVIATGGLAKLLARYCSEIDKVEPFFTLQGIRVGFEALTTERVMAKKRGRGRTS
ncbi:type III pantothenate kinase [soil metagenome]